MKLKLLKPLVLMQLKDKLDYGFLKSVKKTISKVGFSIILFALVCAFDYLLFFMAKTFNIFSLINFVPTSVVTVIFTLMLTLSIFSCTYGLMKSLYFSKDNIVLLTFPVSPDIVFISKLIVFYIYELKKTIYFLLPLFWAYGMVGGFQFFYYLWVVFGLIFIALIPVALGALLSIPAMLIAQFLKQHRVVQWGLILSGCGLLFFGTLKGISLIPANINLIGTWGKLFWRIQDFLKQFVHIFDPFNRLALMLIGEYKNFHHTLFSGSTFLTLLLVILLIAGVIGLCFLLVKPLFYKMASKPFEYKKVIVKHAKKDKQHKKFISAVRKEFMINLRSPETLIYAFSIFSILPISIFLLNKIYSAMNTNLLGVNLTYAFNLLVILLIVLSSNSVVATLYSKEGASGYLNKIKPANMQLMLISKLVFNFVVVTASLLFTMFILGGVTTLGVVNIILMFFTILFLYTAHLFWSAEMDIMNPQNNQYATTGNHVSNPNETKSSIFAFVFAFIYFGFSIMLFGEGVTTAWIKLMCISIALLALRIYLFLSKIKVYFKEV